jgi:mono/diheme cytochrome c family protein
MKRDIIIVTVIIAAATLIFSPCNAQNQQKKGEPWAIPAEYSQMINPVANDEASVKAGQLAYEKRCAFCHGKTGLGDGVKGKLCRTFPGDFSGEAFQDYTDGEIFYQTRFGRGEMPAYDTRVSDTEIWNMVNYMRTLKKQQAAGNRQ